MVVTIRGGRKMINPPMLVDDVIREEMVKSKNVEMRDKKAKDQVSNEVVIPRKLKPVCRPLLPFPKRLKKNKVGRFRTSCPY